MNIDSKLREVYLYVAAEARMEESAARTMSELTQYPVERVKRRWERAAILHRLADQIAQAKKELDR